MSLPDLIAEFYRSHRGQLFTCALAVVRCPDRAEDAVHDAFARLFELRTPPRNLRAYAFRAVRNAAIDLVRRAAAEALSGAPPEMENLTNGSSSTILFNGADHPGSALDTAERVEIVTRALDTLEEIEREVIVMHLFGELKFREISDVLDCPTGTVVSRYRRGIEKLRERVGEL